MADPEFSTPDSAAEPADLIFIGNKGTSALARFLLGSTAERVVRYARCSVLVVRATAE